MTGRHEFKNGVTHTILERERLTLQATTLASVLQEQGYATGIFGKWHLGDEEPYRPDKRGFQETFIHGAGGIGQSFPGSCGDAPGNQYQDPFILHNGVFEKTEGYCTDVFFRQALRWMDSRRETGKPFLTWIATNAPHDPYIAKASDLEKYKDKVPDAKVANFYGMISNIDENVGALLDKLAEWNIAEKTLVIFMNDNGGTAGVPIFNAGMRGQKGSPWIGGTHASCFWRWPQTIQPADCRALAAHIDLFPTLASLAGAELSQKVLDQVEGRSLVPLLKDPMAPWADRELFTHVGRWPKGEAPNKYRYRNCSVRNSRWHLVSIDGAQSPQWQLFDVLADPSEATDLANQNPAVVRAMEQKFNRWWNEVTPMLVNESAVGPDVNPFKELFWKQYGKSKP
jgi:arylsulfatase